MTTHSKNFSLKHLLTLLGKSETDTPYELVCGSLNEKYHTTYDEIIIRRIAYFLNAYVVSRHCGRVAIRERFIIDNHNVYISDVAFTTAGKPNDSTLINSHPPSLALEIVTDDSRAKWLDHKAKAYLRAGTQIVWVAYPEAQAIEVYSLAEDGRAVIQVRHNDSHLTGGSLLPDFKMPVSVVFNG